jgi:uncharacterized protein YkwD
MRAFRRILGIAILGLTVVSLLASESASADTGGDETDFVARINGLRTAHGLAPLAVTGPLADVARAWSASMAGAGAISHNAALSAQAPSTWRRLGENVGEGTDTASLFDAFVNSPVHFANMVDPAFNALGVGVVRDAGGQLFVTMDFMTAGTAAAAPAPVLVRRVVKVCTRNRRGRPVCVRKVRMVAA